MREKLKLLVLIALLGLQGFPSKGMTDEEKAKITYDVQPCTKNVKSELFVDPDDKIRGLHYLGYDCVIISFHDPSQLSKIINLETREEWIIPHNCTVLQHNDSRPMLGYRGRERLYTNNCCMVNDHTFVVWPHLSERKPMFKYWAGSDGTKRLNGFKEKVSWPYPIIYDLSDIDNPTHLNQLTLDNVALGGDEYERCEAMLCHDVDTFMVLTTKRLFSFNTSSQDYKETDCCHFYTKIQPYFRYQTGMVEQQGNELQGAINCNLYFCPSSATCTRFTPYTNKQLLTPGRIDYMFGYIPEYNCIASLHLNQKDNHMQIVIREVIPSRWGDNPGSIKLILNYHLDHLCDHYEIIYDNNHIIVVAHDYHNARYHNVEEFILRFDISEFEHLLIDEAT